MIVTTEKGSHCPKYSLFMFNLAEGPQYSNCRADEDLKNILFHCVSVLDKRMSSTQTDPINITQWQETLEDSHEP